jgi:hypothetical protein
MIPGKPGHPTPAPAATAVAEVTVGREDEPDDGERPGSKEGEPGNVPGRLPTGNKPAEQGGTATVPQGGETAVGREPQGTEQKKSPTVEPQGTTQRVVPPSQPLFGVDKTITKGKE